MKLRSFVYLLLSLSLFAGQATSAPDSPSVPAQFTAPLLSQMLDKVDQGFNYPVLKVGYFLGRRKQPVSLQAGLRMVEERVKKEKPGSQRWIMFEALQAFGLLHDGQSNLVPALNQYNRLFSQVAVESDAKSRVIFLRVIEDFVSLTSTRLVVGSKAADPLTDKVLQRAFTAYARLGSPIEDTPIAWIDSIWRVSDNPNQWVNLIQGLERDAKILKNFGFYYNSALVIYSANTGADIAVRKETLETDAKSVCFASS